MTVRWHVRSADSGGRLARAEVRCGGGEVHRHTHPCSDERLQVIAGTLAVELTLGPGDCLSVPAGVPHSWCARDEARFFVELDPPYDFEQQLETLLATPRKDS
jgi:quercetin dioxygenase-like cupin family protein